ncbi:unnamed protein product [Heterosigma akashiwo]
MWAHRCCSAWAGRMAAGSAAAGPAWSTPCRRTPRSRNAWASGARARAWTTPRVAPTGRRSTACLKHALTLPMPMPTGGSGLAVRAQGFLI